MTIISINLVQIIFLMISNKCYYGLCAMLVLSKREGTGPVTISDIANCQGIPVRFLEAILRQLKHGGVADSRRGKDGGYFLARPASKISVGEVIRLIEGPMAAFAPVSGKAEEKQTPAFVELLETAQEALSAVYEGVSFAEIARRDDELNRKFVENYSI